MALGYSHSGAPPPHSEGGAGLHCEYCEIIIGVRYASRAPLHTGDSVAFEYSHFGAPPHSKGGAESFREYCEINVVGVSYASCL